MTTKYTIKVCSGYWTDEPSRILSGARVALESWDEVEDHWDESIFYYMDNQPLQVGSMIAEGFIVTEIEGD
jgi:hypothetical protein